MRFRKMKNSQGGFTFAEMAVAVGILGVMLAAALVAVSSMLSKRAEISTLKRMETIANALSIYAQHNMRLPCPADPAGGGPEPFGAEWGSGPNGTNYGNCTAVAGRREGILPYFTLGIPAKYIRDEWGNFFTYRVSPSAAYDPMTNFGPIQLGLWCQTEPVWHDGTRLINPPKSTFCCGTFGAAGPGNTGPVTDIILTGPHNAILMPQRQVNGMGGHDDDYDVSGASGPTIVALQDRFFPLYPAYILVSHGQNGFGAFNGLGNARIPGAPALGPELENSNGDNVFFVTDRLSVASPSATGGGPDLFRRNLDDIVFWQSQAQVMSRLGETSCARPWNL